MRVHYSSVVPCAEGEDHAMTRIMLARGEEVDAVIIPCRTHCFVWMLTVVDILSGCNALGPD